MWLYLASAPCKLLNDAAIFAGPIFLGLMVNVVDAGQPLGLAYVYAVLMLIGLVIGTIADNHHYQLAMRGGASPAACQMQTLNPVPCNAILSNKARADAGVL